MPHTAPPASRRERNNEERALRRCLVASRVVFVSQSYHLCFDAADRAAACHDCCTASTLALVDRLPISLETTKLVGEYIRAEANLKLKIRHHGRRSWIPRDLAAGGS